MQLPNLGHQLKEVKNHKAAYNILYLFTSCKTSTTVGER